VSSISYQACHRGLLVLWGPKRNKQHETQNKTKTKTKTKTNKKSLSQESKYQKPLSAPDGTPFSFAKQEKGGNAPKSLSPSQKKNKKAKKKKYSSRDSQNRTAREKGGKAPKSLGTPGFGVGFSSFPDRDSSFFLADPSHA
jgi:hypothetical protein